MNRNTAIAALKEQAGAVKALGATALYLFGSTRRDEASQEGDLDLFLDYDAAGRFSLIQLVGIKQLLEQRLRVPVDVTHPRQPRSSLAEPHRSLGGTGVLMARLVRLSKYDVADYLDCDEMIGAYLDLAAETGDRDRIAVTLGNVARARAMRKTASAKPRKPI